MDAPAIAARQAGAFTRRDAAAAGFARGTVRRRIADGRWRVLVGDVLVRRDALVTDRTRAWAAHLATGGVVSHQTAATLHGYLTGDRSMHVSSRIDLHVRVPGIIEHRVRLGADDVVSWGGLPVTTRLRTLVDVLATSEAGAATALLFRAVQQDWISEGRLGTEIERRRGMRGNTQLRRLVDLLGTGAHSVAERELHRIIEGIAGVTFEANKPLVVGAERYVVDVVLSTGRIVIEVDGRRYHSDEVQFTRDRRRQNALVGAGWTVLRFTWLDLVEAPARVRATIVTALSVSSGQ